MGIFRKQTVRAPWTTVLLVLLLALSIAASSIGFAAWMGANKQFEEIDRQYTTIAVPSGLNQEKQYEAGMIQYIGFDSREFSDGSRYYGPFDLEATAKGSEHYQGSDHRVYLSAHVEGGIPVTSGTLDLLNYNYELDNYCYQTSVLAVRCVSLEKDITYDWTTEKYYSAYFEIVDRVCQVDAYDVPPYDDELRIHASLHARDGEIPFEVGKTYLVRGIYWDYDVVQDFDWVTNDEGVEQWRSVPKRALDGELGSIRKLLIQNLGFHEGLPDFQETGITYGLPNWNNERMQNPETGEYYDTVPEENCWPYWAQYEGDWRDFLKTEEGRVWKEEIIPNFEMNHSSVPVILTDDANSMYFFNSGDASILDGAFFTDADYRNGNTVCLVSAAYAKQNGLTVGDTIKMDFFHNQYEMTRYTILQGSGRSGMTIVRDPLTDKDRIGVEKDYTVVGIYSAPEWQAGSHAFHADTVIVPKSSVPDADKYAGPSMPLLNTVIIENGSIDAFEAHMAANDKAGAYLYFDQGYTEAAATVQTLIDNAMRLMLVGVAMFLLASMLFLLLFARRVSAVMRSMRLLGVPKRKTWLESLAVLFAQELTAVAVGNALAVVLYERITAQLLAGTPALDAQSILLCGGVQLWLLGLAGSIWMYEIAGRNLMQRSSGVRNKRIDYTQRPSAISGT